MRERGRRTLSRTQLAAAHGRLQEVSPGVGRLDESAFHDLLRSDADAAVALIADLGAATDPALRAQARRLAARLFVRAGRLGPAGVRGYRRLESGPAAPGGDLDLERTLERAGGRPRHAEDLVARHWSAPRRAVCLLIDHSGSMRGHAVGLAAMAAAAVVLRPDERVSCSVVAFATDALVLQRQGERRPAAALVDDLLSLRGTGRTDLALALGTAARELRTAWPRGGAWPATAAAATWRRGASPTSGPRSARCWAEGQRPAGAVGGLTGRGCADTLGSVRNGVRSPFGERRTPVAPGGQDAVAYGEGSWAAGGARSVG